jgi:hypothetical protein
VGQSPPAKHNYIKGEGKQVLTTGPTRGYANRRRRKGEKAKRSQQNKAKTITRLAARARWKDEDLL